ncbi:MAG: hypothetical protein QQW96_03945 [Tychonema bourrellyi B0820]|nr:hypothetical protein [Tychonema bourrellyi B0820]
MFTYTVLLRNDRLVDRSDPVKLYIILMKTKPITHQKTWLSVPVHQFIDNIIVNLCDRNLRAIDL